jgi:L-seryl-tRNA(Ser) seleniumtransferase
MAKKTSTPIVRLPSVDRLANTQQGLTLIERYGRTALIEAIRAELASRRLEALAERVTLPIQAHDAQTRSEMQPLFEALILTSVATRLRAAFQVRFRPVLNMTGTVLHTNLGRAPLPQEALDAIVATASGASNLEFDLHTGKRGDRDDHVESLLCQATGAEAATVVNNNAAAVLLVLNALALKREVPVSRGELVEIGGSFRIPDIMSRAGCRLVEVGTTNRTHLSDFEAAFNPKTALVMKVHTSNYRVEGFTASVPEPALSRACQVQGIPFVVDLGAGSLIDLSQYGLPAEPTPRQTIARGADLVLFSGDKLLGGPQVGIIVGRADLIAKIKRNPLKRALRIDKMSMAALEAVLRLYLDPDALSARLPTLRLLTRTPEAIAKTASLVLPVLAARLAGWAQVRVVECASEIGSGAQPGEVLKSAGLAILPLQERGRGRALQALQASLRDLPVPVIARIEKDELVMDCRCIEDEALLIEQIEALAPPV